MVQPKLVSETPINMVELKEEIERIKKRDKELNMRVNKVEDYLNQFVSLSDAKAKELYNKLEKLDIPRLKDVHIHKIIDTMPDSVEKLKVILQGYTITVNSANMKKIVDTVNSFVEKKKK